MLTKFAYFGCWTYWYRAINRWNLRVKNKIFLHGQSSAHILAAQSLPSFSSSYQHWLQFLSSWQSSCKIWLRMERKLDVNPLLANRKYGCVDIEGLWKRIHITRVLILSVLGFKHKEYISLLPMIILCGPTQDASQLWRKGENRPCWSSNQAIRKRLRIGI